MRKAMSIQIEEAYDSFIDKKVSEGRYASRDEVVEAGLRLLMEQDEELEAIRQALIEGEESGEPVAFDFDAFVVRKRRRRGA